MREPSIFRDLTLFLVGCMNIATAILADRQTCISFSVERRETPRRFSTDRIPCCVFQSPSSKFRFLFNLSRLRGGDPGGEDGLERVREEKNKATEQQYRWSEGGRVVQQDMPQSPYCESEDHTGRRAHAPIHREGGAASFEARSRGRGSKDGPISQSERREMLLRQGWERSSNLREGFRAREIEVR